jgi:outer membrane protein OmpA-like peptidoglycan-associated protein
MEQVLFATDSDEIVGADSFAILDMVARVLTARPDIRVQVQGHTDDQGTREHNLDLSRRRAESVRAYLISRGIVADRLEAQGFGPDVPIASNRSREGREQNRRVEFHIIPSAEPPAEIPPAGEPSAPTPPPALDQPPAAPPPEGGGEMDFSG